jgi:hypothetical protein
MRTAIVALALASAAAAQNWPALPPQSAPPGIALSVNYSAEPHLIRGWPVFARARIFHPQCSLTQKPAAFVLAPSIAAMTGSWMDAVTLKVTNAKGTIVKWGFQPVGRTASQQLQIDASRSAIVEWQIPGEATRAIPPGQYFVQAVLNVSGGSGWTGSVESTKVAIQISDEPAALKETDRYMKALLTFDIAGNNLDQAFASADAFNKAFPQNVPGIELKARVLERQKKFRDARDLAGKAIETYFAQKPAPKEPPVPLLELFDRLNEEVFSPPSTAK